MDMIHQFTGRTVFQVQMRKHESLIRAIQPCSCQLGQDLDRSVMNGHKRRRANAGFPKVSVGSWCHTV